jgi:hypothetical protein
MSGHDWRELCHCGHHKDTHFDKKHCCLGMHCDCAAYRDVNDPLPTPRKLGSHLEITDTKVTPLLPHPMWCTCVDCSTYDTGDP